MAGLALLPFQATRTGPRKVSTISSRYPDSFSNLINRVKQLIKVDNYFTECLLEGLGSIPFLPKYFSLLRHNEGEKKLRSHENCFVLAHSDAEQKNTLAVLPKMRTGFNKHSLCGVFHRVLASWHTNLNGWLSTYVHNSVYHFLAKVFLQNCFSTAASIDFCTGSGLSFLNSDKTEALE